jgi:fatty acid CoA ligase FadD9
MTRSARKSHTSFAGVGQTFGQRTARRATELYSHDNQFRGAMPLPDIVEAARHPGLRLPQVIQTYVQGYGDRPALGWRARALATDPETGRTTGHLQPRFEHISYRDLWANVRAAATAWRQDSFQPLAPGDIVATVGFASADYLTIDLVCGYLGLVAVPLQHNASLTQLQQILAEVEPHVLAVSVAHLELAVESALGGKSLRRLVIFDYEPKVDDQREGLVRARARLEAAGMAVIVETLAEVIDRGKALSPEPIYTGSDDQRLAMIVYTSGSTGLPKGAMYTESMVSRIWTADLMPTTVLPVLNVNFMPLNHLGGRIPLATSFQAGGTSFFVPESDLSTLFEDWNLVRPTEVALVPRVVEMLFQRYQSGLNRRLADGLDAAAAEAKTKSELRDHVLGGRVLTGFVGTAPLAAEMRTFIESCLDTRVLDGYGSTEVGMVTVDGAIRRPPVIDYRLVDVPELGYYTTDQPHPRGELLVKSATATLGYFKRPEITAQVFDADGYYRTGDVMAEIAPDQLTYVDRRNNVLKLAQGEFVAVAHLESVFAGAAMVRQIFVYGNSQRPYLLAVVVPTTDAVDRFADDEVALKSRLRESLRQAAKAAELRPYELPADFLVESEPFTTDNGLLSAVGKVLRPKLKQLYGERLEQLYAQRFATQVDDLRALKAATATGSVFDTLTQAAQAFLGVNDAAAQSNAHFIDLGGDSLSALTFSELLRDLFEVEVPVGVIISPTTDLRQLADYIEAERGFGAKRPTFSTVHGHGTGEIRSSELTLDKFIEPQTLREAASQPSATGVPHTVLLTGANGYLGRFLALDWLQRLSETNGRLICIIRGRDAESATKRLEAAFDSGDAELVARFQGLAAERLEVIAGDISRPNFGLAQPVWDRLAQTVDLIVHPAALVNHVLPYDQLFGPNVEGTAELIRLAITARIKPVAYLSTVAVTMSVDPADFIEDGDIRAVSAVRPIDDSYANGYANSKWAGEVLLREAHDLCGMPVAVFRSDMILAHSRYAGQLNVPDAFTRLMLSLLTTGIAPSSFYQTDAGGRRPRAHYDGLPVDFIAELINSLSEQTAAADLWGFRSFNVMNPHDDGISLDVFVDWMIDAGYDIQRIDDYADWLERFETALRALPDEQRQHSVLPLLGAFSQPAQPLRGAAAPTKAFREAVRTAKITSGEDIPRLSASLIRKYITDLTQLGLFSTSRR